VTADAVIAANGMEWRRLEVEGVGELLDRGVYYGAGRSEAARFSGVPVDRVRVILYAISGLMAAVAGLLYASYFATAQADAATVALLDVVAAVVLGGVNIFGGSGSILGVFLAVVLIAVLRNGMGLANIAGDTQSIVIGGLLLGAILVGNLLRSVREQGFGRRLAERLDRKEAAGDEQPSGSPSN